MWLLYLVSILWPIIFPIIRPNVRNMGPITTSHIKLMAAMGTVSLLDAQPGMSLEQYALMKCAFFVGHAIMIASMIGLRGVAYEPPVMDLDELVGEVVGELIGALLDSLSRLW